MGNGLTETRGYSPRTWLNSLQVGSVYSLTNLTYAGNGDVLTAYDTVNGNWTYGYDAFNRLTSAAKTGVSYSWDYDRFGNRWHQTQVGVGAQALTFNQNNQITNPGFIYDAAGNLMMDNVNCYSYDAENRLVSTVPETLAGVCGAAGNGTDYLYDPDGRRVAKIQNGAIVKQFYYDAAGQEIAETNASGTLNRAEIVAGSRHLATWSNNATYFDHADWLGTERARSNSSGTLCWAQSSLPFGDGVTTTINSCTPTPNFFTGKERDTETASSPNANDGLDYFGARYYSSNMGRFMTPDWADKPTAVPYANFGNPQSLNLYGYVENNPLTVGDPDGHCVEDACVMEFLAFTALVTYTVSPQGQQVIRNGINALLSTPALIQNTFKSSQNEAEQSPQERGRENEQKGLEAAGAEKNTTPVSAVDPKTGEKGTTIPDGKGPDGHLVEVKDAKRVADSKQLRLQNEASKQSSGKPSEVVTGEKTKVSKTVQREHPVRKIKKLGPQD